MIDFVKMSYKDKVEAESFILKEENFPKMRAILEIHTGVIEYPYKTKLENMDIHITNTRVYLKNSLHKLNNSRKKREQQNYNDFTYSELIENVEFINSSFPKIEDARLSQLESGLNIKTNNPAEIIIRENIIMHNYKIHNEYHTFKGKGEYKQFGHSNYYIKVYDKAKQYNLSKNILRFEIKYIKSRGFNNYGIHNILDLKDKDKLRKLYENLLQRFDEMLIIDDYKNNPKILKKTKNQIEKYTNYNYWGNISNRTKKSRERTRFKEILEKYKLLKIKEELREKLVDKFEYLINN